MSDEKEFLQKLSERTCYAYKQREEFVKDVEKLFEKYPIDREIKYDFRREPIQKDVLADTSEAKQTAGRGY